MKNVSMGSEKMSTALHKTNKEGEAYKSIFSYQKTANEALKMSKNVGVVSQNTEKLGSNIQRITKGITESHTKFAHFADFFAMSAFFRLMNVGWPIMAIAIPGLEELGIVESASVALKGMVGNFSEINKYANELVHSTTYSKGEIMGAARIWPACNSVALKLTRS